MERKLRDRPRTHEHNTRSQQGRSAAACPQYNESLARPSWDPAVRDKIFEDAHDPTQTNKYKCAITGQLCDKEKMQIDHIEAWEQWCLQHADPKNLQEWSQAYNDPRNLRLVHGGVNASKGNRKQPGRGYLANLE